MAKNCLWMCAIFFIAHAHEHFLFKKRQAWTQPKSFSFLHLSLANALLILPKVLEISKTNSHFQNASFEGAWKVTKAALLKSIPSKEDLNRVLQNFKQKFKFHFCLWAKSQSLEISKVIIRLLFSNNTPGGGAQLWVQSAFFLKQKHFPAEIFKLLGENTKTTKKKRVSPKAKNRKNTEKTCLPLLVGSHFPIYNHCCKDSSVKHKPLGEMGQFSNLIPQVFVSGLTENNASLKLFKFLQSRGTTVQA